MKKDILLCAAKGIFRAALEGFCLNVFLPLWFLVLKREGRA